MPSRRDAPLLFDQHSEPAEDLAALRAKALAVHHVLCSVYGCPVPFWSDDDPLSSLVGNLLSHRTKNADSARAFGTLRATFLTWEGVRDAPVSDVQQAIRACTWPEQKAPRIQAVLREVSKRRGELNVDFLGELSVPEARAWLESIPGVGPKTSAATLLFSTLRMPAMPVDSHHHRVALRLELIPAGTDVGPSHALLGRLLPPDWDAQQVYDHHEVYMMHGQQCCFYNNPACGKCAVLEQCKAGQARLGGEDVDPARVTIGRSR